MATKKEKTNDISRKAAARLIDEIRVAIAEEIAEERMTPFVEKLLDVLAESGVSEAGPCSGQAHDPEVGGMIDNCGVCMQSGHWGWSYRPTKVK